MKLLLASLLPAATASWMLTPRFYDTMMMRPSQLIDSMLDTTLLSPTPRLLMDRNLPAKSSPKYEITDSDNQVQIVMDVPGVEKDNLDISIHQSDYSNNPIISISGHRESKDESSTFSYKFSQSFSLPADIDAEHFAADLTNGVLTVTAPKDPKRLESSVRKIPITADQAPQKLMNAAAEEGTTKVNVEAAPKEEHVAEKKETVATA